MKSQRSVLVMIGQCDTDMVILTCGRISRITYGKKAQQQDKQCDESPLGIFARCRMPCCRRHTQAGWNTISQTRHAGHLLVVGTTVSQYQSLAAGEGTYPFSLLVLLPGLNSIPVLLLIPLRSVVPIPFLIVIASLHSHSYSQPHSPFPHGRAPPDQKR